MRGANRLNRTGHTYGSCKGKDAQGYGRAETEVQAESLTAALVAQSCMALALAVAVTAAAEAGRGNEMCENYTPPPILL